MIEKGFSNPTLRINKLKEAFLNAVPELESERAVLITESYKSTENLPVIVRRAKALEKILQHRPIVINDGELIVGSSTKKLRSAEVFPEFSCEWIEKEFETIANRQADPFIVPKDVSVDLKNTFEYWKGKTVSDLALSYMSQEAKDCIEAGVFTVGNYLYGGIGHITVNYGEILQNGFNGIIEKTQATLDSMDACRPDYAKKKQFYQSIIISYTAAINFAHRYADLASELAEKENNSVRKTELLQIAKNCRRVPEYGATNFWEACQSFWFIQLLIQIEASGHSVSPGRFDQYMNPYFQADKSISKDFAQELIDCLWIKLNHISKCRDEVSAQAFAGYGVFQNLCVGGQNENGVDASNDISYMCMDATAHVRLPQPSFSIRVWQGTKDEFLYRACEVVRLGFGLPAMYNDEVIIPALQNRGVKLKDARDYNLIGCVEPTIPYRTEGEHDAAFVNVAKILEITLKNGRVNGKQYGPETGEIDSFHNIDELFTAFKKQVAHFVQVVVDSCNCVDMAHAERAPLPFISAMVNDCIGRGISIEEGGALYNFTGPQAFGVSDAGDSLYAIQKNVFEDKRITMYELKSALDENFGYPVGATLSTSKDFSMNSEKPLNEDRIYQIVNDIISSNKITDITAIKDEVYRTIQQSTNTSAKYEDIRRILDNTPSYGNDFDIVDEYVCQCAQVYCLEVEKYKNPRDGLFQAGIYPVSANVLFGKYVDALPDGRLAKMPLADGVSPRQGKDINGPTAAANSVAKLDHFLASNGTLYNQKFLPSALAGDSGMKNFASMVRSYFDKKGMHIQFNVINRTTLLDAQQNPEKYKDLVVRVAGYSAQFVVLAKDVQDDIISRTEQQF